MSMSCKCDWTMFDLTLERDGEIEEILTRLNYLVDGSFVRVPVRINGRLLYEYYTILVKEEIANIGSLGRTVKVIALYDHCMPV